MHQLMMTLPHSTLEPVTDVFHGEKGYANLRKC